MISQWHTSISLLCFERENLIEISARENFANFHYFLQFISSSEEKFEEKWWKNKEKNWQKSKWKTIEWRKKELFVWKSGENEAKRWEIEKKNEHRKKRRKILKKIAKISLFYQLRHRKLPTVGWNKEICWEIIVQ